jgi:hypothetical protein
MVKVEMDEEKLSRLIVDKMSDRIGDSIMKMSLMLGVASISLFLYGKYCSIEKGLKRTSE